jgi:hypothetical protein
MYKQYILRLKLTQKGSSCQPDKVMRTYAVTIYSALLAGSISTGACVQQAPHNAQPLPKVVSPTRQYVPGEIIVQFHVGTTHERIHEIIAVAGARPKKDLGALTYLVSFSNGRTMDEFVASLRIYPEVQYAEPNWITRIKPPQPISGPKPGSFGQ